MEVLSAGATSRDLSTIYSESVFESVLAAVGPSHHYVIVDLPALAENALAPRFTNLCDGIVLVVEAERIRWEVAQRAKEKLENVNADVLGVVLMKRSFPIPSWLYRTL